MVSATTDRRQGLVGSIAYKTPVDVATTAAITLSGEQTIDGVLTSSSRVLVKNQVDTTTNGIYDTGTGTWTRSIDSNGNYDFKTGTQVYVALGSANKGNAYQLTTTPNPITIGTSNLTWALTGVQTQLSTLALANSGSSAEFQLQDQTTARKVDLLLNGTTNGAVRGIAPGMAGLNTAAGVNLTLGTGDAVQVTLDDGNKIIGIGTVPVAAHGLLQLAGSASGGIFLGNSNNSYANALDWYEEGTWTPALKMGGLLGTTSYSSQVGKYVRFGNLVFFYGLIQINVYDGSTGGIAFSATTPIPYGALSGTHPVLVSVQGVTLTSPGWMAPGHVGSSGAPDVNLRISSAAGSVSAVAGTNITLANGAAIEVLGFYWAA